MLTFFFFLIEDYGPDGYYMFIMFKHTKSSSGSQLLFLRYNNSAVTDLNGNSVSNRKAVNSDTQKSSIFKKF